MRRLARALALLVLPSLAAAQAFGPAPLGLMVLTRSGAVKRVTAGGVSTVLGQLDQPRAITALDGGQVAVLAAGKLQLFDGKTWKPAPGDYADARQLAACGARVFLGSATGVDELDLKTGKRKSLVRGQPMRLFCGGATLYSEQAGVIAPLAGPARFTSTAPATAAAPAPARATATAAAPAPATGWSVPARHARALAGDGDKIYAATREGPLWEFDLAHRSERDLGLGGWWGTMALAASPGRLYAVTQAGKLWQIDPAARTKTIIAMDGWEDALALAVSR